MTAINNSVQWEPFGLMYIANDWVARMRKQKLESSYKSMWWSYLFTWDREIKSTIKSFISGTYKFSPMVTYRFPEQIVTVWDYKDRLILKFLRKIIASVIKHIILPNCYHLNVPPGIKKAINFVRQSLNEDQYRYFIRADIKDYYASIDRRILVKQTQKHFADSRLRKYLKDIITIAIDDGGEVKIPNLGIPRGSSLSPVFGALYLSELDRKILKLVIVVIWMI